MSEMLYRIAHISDLHLQADKEPVHGLVDTCAAARRVVVDINALDPLPDVVVVTGDLTHAGGLAATQAAKAVLSELQMPYQVCLGNHDRRADFLTVFGRYEGWCESRGYVAVRSCGDIRIISLDTVVDDPRSSGLSVAQLIWLRRQLEHDPKTPTVMIMHHPPFDTGIDWLDAMGLAFGRQEFGHMLGQYDCIRCILSGHLHRPMRANWCGVPVYAAPSVMPPVELVSSAQECRSEADIQLVVAGAPGYAVHDFTPADHVLARLCSLDGNCARWLNAPDVQEVPAA